MNRDEMIHYAVLAAQQFGIDPALVCAVCDHESGGWDSWAVRYEPLFYARYIDHMTGLSQTEKTMRATSFGLMQIMGQVAREQGFTERHLTSLCDPVHGVKQGCVKLAKELKKSGGDVRQALLGYNGGGNPGYPDLVLALVVKYAVG